jgi:hypothetical protein
MSHGETISVAKHQNKNLERPVLRPDCHVSTSPDKPSAAQISRRWRSREPHPRGPGGQQGEQSAHNLFGFACAEMALTPAAEPGQ